MDNGPDGRWAEGQLESNVLAAPHLMPVEVDDILRRTSAGGEISGDAASLAHTDLTALRVEYFPYQPFADRVWALRGNITCYDAWYVALAEFLGCELATLDRRLARAPGSRCLFRTPPATGAGSEQ
jgi:predicted nucleic acid-binding protein